MIARWVVLGSLCAGMIVLPALFEWYTFHLYLIRDPSFFTFSGARLWFFLASEIVIGLALGTWTSGSIRLYLAAGAAASSISILVALLYQFCDIRQCYYAGPDGLGAIRLGTLLFSAAAAGLLIGDRSRKMKPPTQLSGINAVMFGTVTVVLLGYYPWSMIFDLYMPVEFWAILLAYASTAPFFLSGFVTHFFADRNKKLAICSAAAGWTVLAALFVSLRPIGWPIAAIMLAIGTPAALLGFRWAPWLMERTSEAKYYTIILVPIVALFAITSVHPFLDAPMNLAIEANEALARPSQYSGAYHQSDRYFATKRVEVAIDMQRFERESIKDFALAGIGAQSPNCCKDGLDYGYRADILFNDSGRFVVARAWETCDQNIACSGFPWMSVMYQSLARLPDATSNVILAMEWRQGSKTVDWYYKSADDSWSNYGSFDAPTIENPYFNLGVISVGNPLTNDDGGNAYFFQAGLSADENTNDFGEIIFHCPAYYDEAGLRQCSEMSPVKAGDSHWKVLWKWGVPNEIGLVRTLGSNVSIESR